MKYFVIFNYGEHGWSGTSQTAAKSVEADSPKEAIEKIKEIASSYYQKTRDFKVWIKS